MSVFTTFFHALKPVVKLLETSLYYSLLERTVTVACVIVHVDTLVVLPLC